MGHLRVKLMPANTWHQRTWHSQGVQFLYKPPDENISGSARDCTAYTSMKTYQKQYQHDIIAGDCGRQAQLPTMSGLNMIAA